MKNIFLAIMFVLPVTGFASGSEAGPYAGMGVEQLKLSIEQLEKELAGVKQQVARLEGKGGTLVGSGGKPWLLDDFESGNEWDTKGAGGWWSGNDENGMGTTRQPDPYKPTKGGSVDSPGYSGRIHGYLGPNEEPWTWSNLAYSFGDKGKDINEYKALEFWIKGNGDEVKIQIQRAKVQDYCYHETVVPTTKEWKKVTVPFNKFQQANWGLQVEHDFNDIKVISWSAGLHETKYDFSIDDVKLLK